MEDTTQSAPVIHIDYMLLCADLEREVKTPSESASRENIAAASSSILVSALEKAGIKTNMTECHKLYGEELTGDKLAQELERAKNWADEGQNRESVMLIVYDSHGAILNGQPTFQTRGRQLAAPAFWGPLRYIKDTVNLLVIIDACFSGELGASPTRGVCITSAQPGQSVSYVDNRNKSISLDKPTSSLCAALASIVGTKPSDLASLSVGAAYKRLYAIFHEDTLNDLRKMHKSHATYKEVENYVCPGDEELFASDWAKPFLEQWKTPLMSLSVANKVKADNWKLFQRYDPF